MILMHFGIRFPCSIAHPSDNIPACSDKPDRIGLIMKNARTDIRNVAIIAHVDHGKTTLVDGLLKQARVFRENQQVMERVMDSNDLERERGITILAKNTAIIIPDLETGETVKINIVDTPGHADFGGEVERVLNMASAALLLVDAAEGPLPQTKFVLKKAIAAKLRIILFINKIDKKDARPMEVKREVENLFLELADHEDVLNFKTLYGVGRHGKAYYDLPDHYSSEMEGDLKPLFETILEEVPNSYVNLHEPFHMLISTLDFDAYVGKLCIGKISRGTLNKGDKITLLNGESSGKNYVATKIFTSIGLQKKEVTEACAGDIIALAGITDLTIGQTVADPQKPEKLPPISVEEPIIKIKIGPNTTASSTRKSITCL